MFGLYLVTGAAGFLGRAVLAELIKDGAKVRALVFPGDAGAQTLPAETEAVYGDVCGEAELEGFFTGAGADTCVIHCAGVVSVASDPGSRLYDVNVRGTKNVIRMCEKHGVGKLVYVSSVHAIPEKPKGCVITEKAIISPDAVKGDYAKSKAAATVMVFEAARRGLNASVVFPSGIIGPGDPGCGSMTHLLLSFMKGSLPAAVKGGYDFVDVRDAAAGITACADLGKRGKGYLLTGQYATLREILDTAKTTLKLKKNVLFLPLCIAKLAAPFCEKQSLKNGRPLYFTPYSVSVLGTENRFSHEAASAAFGYSPRPVKVSIRDTVLWLKKHRFGKE